MNPNMLKEDPRSGLGYDTLFTWCQNYHLRESIDEHKGKIMTMLGGGQT
jgi:hypothetical protein